MKTTAFLCLEEISSAGAINIPKATAFFVSDRSGNPPHPIWAVTARHCIQEARAADRPMFLRVNTSDSFIDIPTSPDNWHEAVAGDVAAAYWLGPPECVITAVPVDQFIDQDYRYRGAADFPFPEELRQSGQLVNVGHEVFFVGLFSQHAGHARNLPVARFGMVARQPIEPVAVRRSWGGTERIEGYLVEARSWGGHSGSPVFWYYPASEVHFIPNPKAPVLPNRAARRRAGAMPPGEIPISRETGIIALLGLVSAHFDIPQEAQTQGDILGSVVTNVNAGIAVVTPAHLIRELIESEPVTEERENYSALGNEEPAATFDIVRPDEPSEYERLEATRRRNT